MSDDPASIPGATPSNYQRTTGGNLRWRPPTAEHLQQLLFGYEVIDMLGMGGMGAVYKARQISLDRMVAIKILPPEASDEEMNFVERFRNEARTMAKMNHPAIVSVFDFGETSEGQLYIVMEYVDGTDVAKMILSQGRLPAEYALAITAHVCDALQYAHTHGIIHRDIKPANILINMEGAVKVADFGLAKATDASQMGLTKTNMAMGTPDFVAPEALSPGMIVDGRADLYAVGVMLYNMLTGNVPRGAFRMPSTTVATDPRFDTIIIKSMEMDREMRYQTAFDIRRDLDVILTTPLVEAGGQSSAAIPKHEMPQKPVARGPQQPHEKSSAPVPDHTLTRAATKKSNLGPILGIAAMVIISIGLYFLFKPKSPTPVTPSPTVMVQPASVPLVSTTPKTTKDSPPQPPGRAGQTPELPKKNDPIKMGAPVASGPAPNSTPSANGAVNLLALVDPSRDKIDGDWKMVNGELKGGGTTEFSRIAFKVPVPEEYDFRISFTRGRGNKAVAQHVPFGGSDVMWLMGGFGNKVSGLEQVGGKAGINNPTTVAGGLENNRRYESVVKVRRDRIQVELDGKLVMEHKSDGSDLSVFEKWKYPDPKKLGVGCQEATVFHSIELMPVSTLKAATLATAPVLPMAVPAITQPAIPAPQSSDPRLAQLAAGFKARYEADAQKPFLTALVALNQSYVTNGIGRVRTAAQKKGALAEVTALDAEKARILKNEALPPADLETLPESLKTLRATYRGALAKIEAGRAQKAAPLYDLYFGALDAYIAELTKANKIDEAQHVKTLREDIAAQKPKIDAGVATAPAGGTARNGSKPAPNNIEDSATGGRGSRWYEAALWVVSVGGTMRIEKNGNQADVRSEADIPAGRFAILSIDISVNPKSQSIRDDDFTRLSGLRELTRLYLANVKVTDAAFSFLPTTPALTYLVLAAVPVTDGVLAHIAPLTNLTELQVQSAPQFTGAGLERLASLPKLKLVWFSGSPINDAGAKALTGAKSLEQAFLESTAVTDEGVASFGALTKLTSISLSRCQKVHGTTLDTWANKASVKNLGLSSCPLAADNLSLIGKFTNLTSLSLDDVKALNDETLPALAPLTKLTRISLSTSRVTGVSFTALRGWAQLKNLSVGQGTSISAEGLAALVTAFSALNDLRLGAGSPLKAEDFRCLAGLKMLTYLEAPLPTLDDVAMIEIARIASLEGFYTVNSAITAKGIAALKPLKFLTKLTVEGCKNIDDSAITALKDLKLLKEMNIKRTAITAAGAADLKKALPLCRVTGM